jgi:hypothetical protein
VLKAELGVDRAYIVPDHDEPGHRHAHQVAASLRGVGIEVHVVHLPGLHDGALAAKHGRDISNYLETHAIAELRRHAEATPIWTPAAAPTAAVADPDQCQWFDLATRESWPCEPLRPLVAGIVAAGNVVNVAGQSQVGKTLVGMSLTRSLIQGGSLFQKFPVTPVERLLYLVLEDPARRIQERLLDLDHEFPPTTEPGRCMFCVVPTFTLTEEWGWTWLEYVLTNPRRQVLVLDTYQRATPGLESFDDKAQSKILHRLANLTRRLGVTLFILDHIRKQPGSGRRRGELSIDDVKGSGGKAQNADCVILMERTPDKTAIRFQAFSKDFDQPVRVLVRVAPRGSSGPKFTYLADLDDLGSGAQARGAATRQRILDALTPEVWTSLTDVMTAVGLARSTVLAHVKRLVAAGELEDNGAPTRFRRYRRGSHSSDGTRASETDSSENED